jgi:hypothetical protein
LGYRGGLKYIEKKFGISRDQEIDGMDGYDAVRLWQAYQWGDEAALDSTSAPQGQQHDKGVPFQRRSFFVFLLVLLPPLLLPFLFLMSVMTFGHSVTHFNRMLDLERELKQEQVNEINLKNQQLFSKSKANKHLRLIKALFNHAVKRNWLKTNPAMGIEHIHREGPPHPVNDVEIVLLDHASRVAQEGEHPQAAGPVHHRDKVHPVGCHRVFHSLDRKDIDLVTSPGKLIRQPDR